MRVLLGMSGKLKLSGSAEIVRTFISYSKKYALVELLEFGGRKKRGRGAVGALDRMDRSRTTVVLADSRGRNVDSRWFARTIADLF